MSHEGQAREFDAPASRAPALSLELYREIFLHSTEPIAIINPEGYYLEQNAAHASLLGYSDGEIKGQTPAIHIGEAVFADLAKKLRDEGEYRGEIVTHTRGGEKLNIELCAFALREKTGELLGYVGIKRNITERIKVEQALRRSQAEMTDVFDNATIGMHWKDLDGVILRVNQAELDLLGYSRDEYVGHNIAEFFVDPAVPAKILQKIRRGEALREFPARLRCKDGSERFVQMNSSVNTDERPFRYSCCFTHDVTARKRSEQRLALQFAVARILSESIDLASSARAVLEAVCSSLKWQFGALWRVDHKVDALRCVDVWSATPMKMVVFENICSEIEFKRGSGLPGRIWASGEATWIPDVLKDGNFPRASCAEKEYLHAAFGFPILTGTEVLGVVEFFNSEIREPDNELLNMMASLGRQIGQFTKRKRVEEERSESLEREKVAREEAEQANRVKDEFLATLSHELRTPLNAVIGWSRMLKSGRLDQEIANHALEVIERNAWAQKQIIEDILDVSRVITGKLQLRVVPLDLVLVIDAALDAVRPAMEAKDIHVETTIDSGLRMVTGDPDRLQQVVWNLLSNAAKFTPPGGKVDIRVCQTRAHVEIQVSDTGPGIALTFLPHVFERFRQADGSTTRTHGGLGLGLAIVRHLVELHGGVISVENKRAGHGAIFTIRLPLPTGDLQLKTLAEAAPSFGEPEPTNLEGLKILVVDDESDALDVITMELTQRGAHVSGVTSAQEAFAILEENKFDILISDIGMPEMDGYDLIRKLRRQETGKNGRIPAIALTAYARVQDRMRAILAGYSTHVPKPVESHELITIVASLAGRLGK